MRFRIDRLVPLATALTLAACATAPQVESPYAALEKTAQAGVSHSTHVVVVPHTREAAKEAALALPAYQQALSLMEKGDNAGALAAFQALSKTYPALSGPAINMSLIEGRMTKTEQAIADATDATTINAQNPYAWNALGIAQRNAGHFDEARAAYQHALSLDPQFADAHFNLGVLADLYLGNLPLALTEYKAYQALQVTPDKTVAIWIADLTRRVAAPKTVETTP